jgi:hypothetical protein
MKLKFPTLLLTGALLFAAAWFSRAQDEEARKHWLHELGGPFFISRAPVQEDLHLSEDQKHKIRAKLSTDVQDAEAVRKLSAAEQKPAMQALRQKSYPKLEAFLHETLTSDQLRRFQQLKLQYDVPSIMLQPELGKALGITDAQKSQFMGQIQEMQKAVMPLMAKAKSGGNAKEILQQVTRLRLDCQARIEALLSEPQRAQWKEMTGPPLVIW